MEKQQLSVDDDLLPIYYVHSEVEEKTFSRAWQGHETAVPPPHLNHIPSFNENCLLIGPSRSEILPPCPLRAENLPTGPLRTENLPTCPLRTENLPSGPSRTENLPTCQSKTERLNKYDSEGQMQVKSVGSTPGTNVEGCTSYTYSRVQRALDFHQSHKETHMRTQVSSTSKNSSAQELFLASLLQVQLCVMDLQDQIEITETNHKAKEKGLKISTPIGLDMSPSSILEPEINLPYIEEVVKDLDPQCVDEEESDDTAYSELEVEERLFCDNPLFKNSKVPQNVDCNVRTSIAELASQSAPMESIVNQPSQLLKQNTWGSKDVGTGKAQWHRIIREESLEELQIYEDEWEEKRSVLRSTATTRWNLLDTLPCSKENPVCMEDPSSQLTVKSLLPNIPLSSTNKEEPMKEAGLLFSDSCYWTNFLLPDKESEYQVPRPLTSGSQKSTSPPREEPREGILIDLWKKEEIPQPQRESREEVLFYPCPNEGILPPQKLPREKILLDSWQKEGVTQLQNLPRNEMLFDPCHSEGTLPPRELPSEEVLLDLYQGEGMPPSQKVPRENIMLDPCQDQSMPPPQMLPRDNIPLDLFHVESMPPPQMLPRDNIPLDLCHGEGMPPINTLSRENILLDRRKGEDTPPSQKLPKEETLLDVPQSEGTPPTQELPKEEILLDPCQGDVTQPTMALQKEEILLNLCQNEGAHPVCQGCQGKEHGSIVLPSESTSETLQPTMQQDTPVIVIEQLDNVSTDLETSGSEEVTYVEAMASAQDVEAARCLAMKLFHLDGFDRSQVAPYLQKNNDFSAMVAEEYLALFDFKGKTLDVALRSLLQELVLTGETQERERVLYHFSKRFHSCNPNEFSSADSVHTLTCAIMLLNSDLHGQNIGKSMTAQDFINNLEGMNDGDNFPRERLKGLYHSIRVEKLEWAMSEEKLAAVLVAKPDNLLSVRKKSNPFVDLPAPDPQAPVYKQGMLFRKVHADIDGKKTPWGKRRWKSFHTVLKGMLLFFLKDEYKADFQFPEEVISVHHALAERASDYTKRPNVFRLQTADWRVFLFHAQTSEEMNSWISRINLVAAMFSSLPFAAAVGSQRRFYRPILPSAQSKLDLEEQLQSHESSMDKFTDDLTEHQRNLPDPRSKGRDSEEYHLREEYLRYEKLRYETYVKLLAVRLESGGEDLEAFEARLTVPDEADGETTGLKRSYSSPSLNPESSPVSVKVKRNISERRTYRRIIPKRNKNLV